MLRIADDLEHIVDEFVAGVDQLSAERVTNATNRMLSKNQRISEGTNKLNELKARYGL